MTGLLALLLTVEGSGAAEDGAVDGPPPAIGVDVQPVGAERAPVGLRLGSDNGDIAMWCVWERLESGDTHVSAWAIDVGRWGLVHDMFDEDPSKALQMAPHMRFGGDRSRDLRFGTTFAVDGLLDLPALGGVDSGVFYFGPLFGGGLDVRYASKDSGGGSSGAFLLDGGLSLGARVARLVHVRSFGVAHVDPFERDNHFAEAGALLGVSGFEAGTPLAFYVTTEADAALSDLKTVAWSAHAVLLFLLDD